MANPEHLHLIKQGLDAWNSGRPGIADFVNADLRQPNLSGFNLSYTNLTAANLTNTSLTGANLRGANLSSAKLKGANLILANLSNTLLSRANLSFANLRSANLSGATLSGAILRHARLDRANLSGTLLEAADLSRAHFGNTTIADLDLSEVKGLVLVKHHEPSSIGIDTLYRSHGKIPEAFLRGCGVPDDFIAFIPAHFGMRQAIEFYSCFVSYSSKDEEFAKRLHSRLRDEKLRVWFAPEDIKGGEKLDAQIERAIHVHDRLLLVLSENSIESEWVMSEIRKARNAELEQKRRKLFPIRLLDFQKLKKWKCFDADSEKDLAIEVREYFIPDFSNWKDHDSFERAFTRLLADLRKAEEDPTVTGIKN